MRPLYFLVKVGLTYALRLFYKQHVVINKPKKFFGSTIYVSNHPNSFMDPLVLGAYNKAVVFFMTRSDVFKPWLKPLLWSVHMLPIYRQHDGENTKEKNNDTFRSATAALQRKRNILIFGEGFTDDTPMRSLKPVKKGAVRMGFAALETFNWSQPVYIAAIGINYTDRNTIGSDVIIENGEPICLNDFKDDYLANPSKVINELTKRIEKDMQECVSYLNDAAWFSFHENVMQITRLGMNHENHDESLYPEERLKYSQKLARWINENASSENEQIVALKKDLESYFSLQKKMKIQDQFVVATALRKPLNRKAEITAMMLMWPFALIGFLHAFLPYLGAKKLTEKAFKRRVFWGSVKMMLGKLFGLLFVIPIVCIVTHFYLPYWWLGVIYFLIIPELWRVSYEFPRWWKLWLLKGKMKHLDLTKFIAKRQDLEARINAMIKLD